MFLKETPVLLGSTSLVSLQPPRWAAGRPLSKCCWPSLFFCDFTWFWVSSMPMSDNWNILHHAAFEPESFMSKAFSTEDCCTRSFTPQAFYTRNTCTPEAEAFCTRKIWHQQFFKKNVLHQKRTFAPQAFYCRNPLQNVIGKRTCSANLERTHSSSPTVRWNKDTLIHWSSTTMWC